MPKETKLRTTLPKPSKKQLGYVQPLEPEDFQELQEITLRAYANYKGIVDGLETALGVLHIGHHVGWKGLYMFHNKRTIRKYEEILGINFREFFPETGPGLKRSLGYRALENVKKYWQVVSGDIKVEGKREITN